MRHVLGTFACAWMGDALRKSTSNSPGAGELNLNNITRRLWLCTRSSPRPRDGGANGANNPAAVCARLLTLPP